MNKMKFFIATLTLVTFSVACSSKPKVATQQTPTAAGKTFAQYKELTMVNVAIKNFILFIIDLLKLIFGGL